MAAKRTGLGRGIGALIPTQAGGENAARPVDVFFPDAVALAKQDAERSSAKKSASEAAEKKTPAKKSSTKAASAPKDSPAAAEPELVAVPGARFVELDPASIVPNAVQPRTVFEPEALAELVHSIREIGVLQPIVVRSIPGSDNYELIMGERRLRATKLAGLATIPAIVKDTADEDMLRDALLENLHRAQLNALEEASAYQQLLNDFGITQEQLAERIGRSRPQISNTLRLLRLPAAVQKRVAAGVISAGHARAILSVVDESKMHRLADKIVNEELSVRAAEAAAQMMNGQDEPAPAVRAPGRNHEVLNTIAERLGDRFDTKVKLAMGARKGRMTIDFATLEDLERILAAMGAEEQGE